MMTRKKRLLWTALIAMLGVSWHQLPGRWREWVVRWTAKPESHSGTANKPKSSSPTNGSSVAFRNEPPPVPKFGQVTDRGSVRRVLVNGSEMQIVHAARQEESGREFLQIGTSTNLASNRTWVPADEVTIWDSTVVRPLVTLAAPRTVPVYELTISCAELATNGLPNLRPLARVPIDDSLSDTFWPLFAEQSVLLSGREHRVLRVGVRQPEDSANDSLAVTTAPGDQLTIDIVIVIDNTYSSPIFLAAARQAVSDLVRDLSSNHDVAFAVVLYRDYADGLYFGPNREVTQLLGHGRLVTGHDELLRLLRPITPAPYSSGDFPEAVFDGLFVALKNVPWHKGSRKSIVLFGDSSSHLEDSPKNPYRLTVSKIARLARERDVRLVPVFITGAGGVAEQHLHRRQAEELAEQTDGRLLEVQDLPQLSQRLLSLDNAAPFKTSTADATRDHGLITGWTLASLNEQPLFERGWLLSGAQIAFLRSELAGLAANLLLIARNNRTSNSESIPANEISLDDTVSQASLFFSQSHGETWSAMMRRAGLPVSRGLFERTQKELLELPSSEQRRLAESIRRDWLHPLRSFEISAHATADQDVFVPVALLP